MMDNVDTVSRINELLLSQEFTLSGITALERPLSIEFYRSWLRQGYHGEMSYLQEHLEKKENPKLFAAKANCAIVVAQSYLPHPYPNPKLNGQLKKARISLYSQGEDYHFWLRKKLEATCVKLQQLFPEEEFIPVTDSAPIMERDFAYRAGLGWIGKNTCLIHPKKGSLFLLGEIVTTLKLNLELNLQPDFCGTCTRCIDVCPTGAITEPRNIDARLCISYLTIESRQVPPEPLREKMKDWLFGCDLCQTVCPWNQKIYKNQLDTSSIHSLDSKERAALIEELRFLLTASGKQIEKTFIGTALKRAGPFGLRRNALIVTANQKLHELKAEVKKWEKDPRLQDLVIWVLRKLN